MEDELKTLEDLNRKVHKNWHPKNKLGFWSNEKCTEDNCPITDFEKELKAEAVKRAKHFRKQMNNKDGSVYHDGEDCLNYLCPCFIHGRIMELKENFNLTEEDLEDE